MTTAGTLPPMVPTAASTVLRLDPPFRAEHVGSLLRPPQLLERRAQFDAKQCTAEELKAEEDAAIAAAVKFQQEVGIQSITDGEMRRGFFYEGMFEKLEGMENVVRPIETFSAYLPYVQTFITFGMKEVLSVNCTGRIHRPKTGIHVADFVYLKSLVPPQDVKNIKINICGPTWMHLRHGAENTYDHSVYKDDEMYFADLAQAYVEELKELYYLGCRNIQFDDPTFAFFCADSTIEGMEEAGVDSEKLFDTYIKLYNDILKNRPAELTIGLHTCRGNYKGMHYCEGGYDRVAQKLFNKLNVDCYYLEYDNDRAGSLEPLKYLPLNKAVVLGLVTTKSGTLETVEEIRDRVDEAVDLIMEGNPKRSRAYALNQICVSPQCGFASVAEGNPITEQEQRQKLALVVEVAKKIFE